MSINLRLHENWFFGSFFNNVKNEIGIGIIGTGFARRVQIPAFLSCDGVRIASIASGSLENAQNAAAEFGIGHFSDDWRETVSHPNVDLVCITTPPNLHREMALFAIEKGKHILCEKPMAMNVREAADMALAAESKPILALIDHELRFQPGRKIAHKMLRDGAIGMVRHAKATFQAPHRGDATLPWNWWSDKSAGGGALGAINSHIIDSFNWFLDAPVESLFCQLQSHIKERRVASGEMRPVTTDDEANMLLRFADGDLTMNTTGLVSVSMVEQPNYRNSLEFYGTLGALRVDHRGDVFVATGGDTDWREVDVNLGEFTLGGQDTGFARGFAAFAPNIVAAIREERPVVECAATFADGLEVQRVLDAARESDLTGRRVHIAR